MIPPGSSFPDRILPYRSHEYPDASRGTGDRRTAALSRSVDVRLILDVIKHKRRVRFETNGTIFRQGDTADCIYVIESGRIKLSRVCGNGREVILSLLSTGDFLGEKCLIGAPLRTATAVSLENSQLLQFDKQTILELLRNDQQFAEHFMAYLLIRNLGYEDELESQLANTAEVRLARCLRLLARAQGGAEPAGSIPHIGHETLAQIVGTTQGRISHFMRSFQKRGLIEYTRREILVRSDLLEVMLNGGSVLADKAAPRRERVGMAR